jgi:hypothetical protein
MKELDGRASSRPQRRGTRFKADLAHLQEIRVACKNARSSTFPERYRRPPIREA